jgi:hypothetical protein
MNPSRVCGKTQQITLLHSWLLDMIQIFGFLATCPILAVVMYLRFIFIPTNRAAATCVQAADDKEKIV